MAAHALQEQDIEVCQWAGAPDVLGSGAFGQASHILYLSTGTLRHSCTVISALRLASWIILLPWLLHLHQPCAALSSFLLQHLPTEVRPHLADLPAIPPSILYPPCTPVADSPRVYRC